MKKPKKKSVSPALELRRVLAAHRVAIEQVNRYWSAEVAATELSNQRLEVMAAELGKELAEWKGNAAKLMEENENLRLGKVALRRWWQFWL